MHTSLKLRTAILPLFLMAGQVIANEPVAGSATQPAGWVSNERKLGNGSDVAVKPAVPANQTGGWVSTEQKLGNGSDVAVKPAVPATTAKPDNRSQQLDLLNEIISSTKSVETVVGGGYEQSYTVTRDDTTFVFTGVDVQGPIQGGRVDTVNGAVNYTGNDSAIALIKAGGSVLRQGGDLAQACTDACKPSSASVVYIQPKTEEGGKKPAPIAVEVTTTELLALAGVSSAADGFNTSNLQTALAAKATPEQALKAAALADYMTGGVGADGKATLWDSISSGVGGGTATRPEDLRYQAALQGSSVGDATNARIELIGALVDEYKSEFNVSDSEALRMAQNYMDAAYDRPMAAGGGGVFDLAPASPEIAAKYGNIAVVDDLLVEGKYSLGSGLADQLFADGLYAGTLGTGGVGNTLSPGQLASEINSGSLSGSGIGAGLNSANTTIPTFQTGVAHTIGGPGTGGVIPTSPSSPVGGGYYGGSGSGDGKYDGAFSWVNDIMLPSTDMIYISLKRMFGGPIETIYQSVIDPSTGRFRKEQGEFNKSSMPPTASTFVVTSLLWIVLVFSALIVVYIFIYGMYRTAKDGQIMGKEWSAIWVPGRAIISTVSIMPIPVVGNFSAIQVFIIMCALLGTAFASTIAAAGFSMMLTQPVIEPVPKEKDGFVADVAKSHLCLASMKKHGILTGEQAVVGYSYVDAGGKMAGKSMANDTNQVKLINSEDGWMASIVEFFSGDKTPDDLKNKNLFIADIFNKSRIDPTRFGVNVAAYGPHGICGVAYLPVHPAEKLVLSDEIMDNISGYEGRTVSVDVKTNLGDLAGGTLVGAAEKSAANSSADAGSGKNPNDDAIVTTLSETAVTTDIWRKELAAARDAKMLDSYKVLDSKVAAAIEKYVNRAPDSSSNSGSAAANVPAESVLASELTLIKKEFYQSMIATTQAALQNINDPSTTIAKTTVRQLGWFSLGTMYWVIEKRQAVLMELFDFTALVHGTGNGRVSDASIKNYKDDPDRLKTVELIDRVVGSTGIRFASEALKNAEKGIDISPSWFVDFTAGSLLRAGFLADIENFNVSPIERVRHFGVVYSNAYIAAVMVGTYFKATMAATKELPYVGAVGAFGESIAESVMGLLAKIAEPIFIGAFICSNILPALPYAMMMAAAVGYLIYVVEALIGANWWMLMAAHPDGHDVWGKGGAGFPIVLTLILRPSLIVIGFFMGVTFNWVVGHWINVTIMPAHNIQNSDTWFHLTQIGGLLLVFSGLHLFAAYKSFSLTWELPNAILRWMGIQDHQDLGEREGKENIMALGMSGGRAMSPAMAGGGKKNPGGGGDGDGDGDGGDKKDRKDKGGEVDPNTDKTPPGAGPGGETKNTKPEGEG